MENNDAVEAGLFGTYTETGTTAFTAATGRSLGYLKVMEAATFSVFTELNGSGDAMTGFAVPAETVLRGFITAFTLTSGKVRGHYNGTN